MSAIQRVIGRRNRHSDKSSVPPPATYPPSLKPKVFSSPRLSPRSLRLRVEASLRVESAPDMQQKFLIPFRAQYRAIHQVRLESKIPHGAFDAVAGCAVQFRVANDTALAHLALTHFELRFDQYHHLAAAT